jgi:hypothetical protein
VVTSDPAIYLIHNLLTIEECSFLVQQASTRLERQRPIQKENDDTQNGPLQQLLFHMASSSSSSSYINTQSIRLWQQGLSVLQSVMSRAMEERMDQATGFPATHFSDFVVSHLQPGAQWWPLSHPSSHPPQQQQQQQPVPMAILTIFLTQPPPNSGGELYYPQAQGGPVKIRPQKGLAVIHHNVNERHEFDPNSVYGLLEYSPLTIEHMKSIIDDDDDNDASQPVEYYIAQKYVYAEPISHTRRVVLPLLVAFCGGRLPSIVSKVHGWMVDRYGYATGDLYFDKLCVFGPVLLLLGLVQWMVHLFLVVRRRNSAVAIVAPKKQVKQEGGAASPRRSQRLKND